MQFFTTQRQYDFSSLDIDTERREETIIVD